MKHKKYIIFSVCIALICGFIGIKLHNSKIKDNDKASTVINNTKGGGTNPESNSTNTVTKETISSDQPSVETSKLDITMIDTTPNTEGNILENLSTGGYFAKQGKWIYFTLPPSNSKPHPIYRAMSDGETGLKAITKEGIYRCINVMGDWVYYLDGDSGPFIFRTKTDGSLTEQVSEFPVLYMFIKDGTIYYGSPIGIYKLRTDSSEKNIGTLIAKGSNYSYFYIINNLIYLLATDIRSVNSDKGNTDWVFNLYTVNLDGTNLKKLSTVNSSYYTFHNNYILYIGDNQRLYRMNLNGTNKMELFNSTVYNLNINNDKIYFTGYGGNQNDIYRSDLNGKNIVNITNNSTLNNNSAYQGIYFIYNLSIIDGYVFYFGQSAGNLGLYKTSLDGSITRQLY
ncbi:DUF5050 domain-containing protein [Candidatus Clostridium stratigraminis]|uniref:DUF5050 domain-containing protein n=1 Tax=Candidatus Clostridium stratigraminis TaxID=3381661 RepID=A0ABW8SZ31_9CLOT